MTKRKNKMDKIRIDKEEEKAIKKDLLYLIRQDDVFLDKTEYHRGIDNAVSICNADFKNVKSVNLRFNKKYYVIFLNNEEFLYIKEKWLAKTLKDIFLDLI